MEFWLSRREDCIRKIQNIIAQGQVNDNIGDDTPLIYSIKCYSFDSVKLLVDAGASVNQRNKSGETPLEWAIMSVYNARNGITDSEPKRIVDLLIKSGADVNAATGDNDTMLGQAIFVKDIEIVNWLINAGADVNAPRIRNFNEPQPLLFYANDFLEGAVALLEHGADPDAKWGYGTILHHAICDNNTELVETLIRHGADLEYDRRMALERANPHILRLLGISEKDRPVQEFSSKGRSGCFIATAVYDNYDAPEVLRLRLYRDTVLTQTALGRIFIRCYYFCSPPVARWLKNRKSISQYVRRILDRMIDQISRMP